MADSRAPAGVAADGLPAGVRRVRETRIRGKVPLHVHPEWAAALPWLVQGTTGAGDDGYDLGLFGEQPVGAALERWRRLRAATGVAGAVHSLQVHGAEVAEQTWDGNGLLVTEGRDGHCTGRPGLLLTVSVADCVPISIVAAGPAGTAAGARIALLHAGWRGTAAGILERGLRALDRDTGSVRVHLGPSICGRCYEVGPDVHEALGLPRPDAPAPADVRAVLAGQAVAAGVPESTITVSEHCTRCGTGFFSHRAGDRARQLGVLALRP